jgi:hypothetical protein
MITFGSFQPATFLATKPKPRRGVVEFVVKILRAHAVVSGLGPTQFEGSFRLS